MFFPRITFAQNIGADKLEIYSVLKCCSCQEPFYNCTCPEAIEMKAYIEALFSTGASKDDIFYKIAKKFSLETIQDEKLKQNIEKRLISE